MDDRFRTRTTTLDAIADRPVHNAFRLSLDVESMRNLQANPPAHVEMENR